MWRLAVFAAWGPVHRRFDTLARPSAAKWLWVGGVAAVAFRAAAYLDRKVFGNRAARTGHLSRSNPLGFAVSTLFGRHGDGIVRADSFPSGFSAFILQWVVFRGRGGNAEGTTTPGV